MVAAVALFAAASCAKELPQENLPAGETVVYSASFDQAETKAVLNETKLQSEWVAGDAITVLDGAKAWNFTTTQAGTDADFANSEGFGEYRPVVAVYPKGAWTANLAEKTVNAYIPTWQQAQKGTYHADAALAVAYSENNEFSFKNAHALLKFTVNADNVTHLVFHGNNEEAFTGNMLVTLDAENEIASVVAQDTEFVENDTPRIGKGTWVECYAWQSDDEKYFEKGATYYIAVAPQVFENGVSVKIRINEGAETLAKTTTKKVEVKRNTQLANHVAPAESSLKIAMDDKPFAFSCLPYTAEEMENATHHEELPPARRTVLCVYGAVRGVGGIDSWGSDVEEAYHVSAEKDHEFSFNIVL